MGCESSQVCINEHRIAELEKDAQRNQETHRNFYDRFEKMSGNMVGYEKDMSYLTSTLESIANDVKEIKEKPAKRWDTLAVCALTTIVGAILGYFLNGILPM